MKYIDKYSRHEEAHDFNVRYLKDCYSGDIHSPIPRLDQDQAFEGFKNPKYADGEPGWRQLLYKEQDGRCCYCMRRLSEEKGTVNYEHVIPCSLEGKRGQEEYAYYAEQAPALRDFVEMADVFAEKFRILSMREFASVDDLDRQEKMPHTIALANLLAACNGKRNQEHSRGCCCNHSRSDDRILPVMLMKDAVHRVQYDKNGILSIVGGESSWKKIIDELNDKTLQEIRSIWYHISRTTYRPENIRALYEEQDMLTRSRGLIELFKQAYGKDNFRDIPQEVQRYAPLTRPDAPEESAPYFYLSTLLAYDWFYDYYRGRKRPPSLGDIRADG